MSNWITDNKPAAMVAGVGLLLFLGLSATGYIVNSKRSELDKKISIAAKEIKSANAAEITPSRSSNEELEKELTSRGTRKFLREHLRVTHGILQEGRCAAAWTQGAQQSAAGGRYGIPVALCVLPLLRPFPHC